MSTYDDLVAAPDPPPRVRDGLLALEKELADHRVVGGSPDGAVSATVSGAGELLEVVVRDRVLRGPHPQQVGPAIVAAVHAARLEATRYARDQCRLVLDLPALPAVATVPPVLAPPPSPGRPTPATRPPAADDGDELFQGFGSR